MSSLKERTVVVTHVSFHSCDRSTQCQFSAQPTWLCRERFVRHLGFPYQCNHCKWNAVLSPLEGREREGGRKKKRIIYHGEHLAVAWPHRVTGWFATVWIIQRQKLAEAKAVVCFPRLLRPVSQNCVPPLLCGWRVVVVAAAVRHLVQCVSAGNI